jgi:hypothetical protein
MITPRQLRVSCELREKETEEFWDNYEMVMDARAE